jgi:uncharacterized protein with PIN domain
MSTAFIRFFARLKDFLAPDKRQARIAYPISGKARVRYPISGKARVRYPFSGKARVRYPFSGPVSIKHAIEALGIPHTEVDLILVNGRSVGFSYMLRSLDQASVYPSFSTLDLSPVQQLREPLDFPLKFIIDSHLGQLATYLRLLGFDAAYRNDYEDDELATQAFEQKRILLTRDRRLLMRKLIIYGFCLQTRDPRQQLRDVLHRYQLHNQIQPWRRCLRCSGRLRPVPKEEILHRLEPKTQKFYNEFHICEGCWQIYWKGSHFEPLRKFIEEIMAE